MSLIAVIPRDFSEGTEVRFSTELPNELVDKVEPQVFADTVNQINAIFARAEALTWQTALDTLLGFASFWLWYKVKESYYSKVRPRSCTSRG
jgi:hypothetical protein